jgi:hypothetical protein
MTALNQTEMTTKTTPKPVANTPTSATTAVPGLSKLAAKTAARPSPAIPPMSAEQLNAIQAKLGLDIPGMSELLGCSIVNFKRWKYSYAVIPRYVARYLVAVVVLHEAKKLDAWRRKAKQY